MTAKADEMKERRALAGSTTTTTLRKQNEDTGTYHSIANLDTGLSGRFSVGGEIVGTNALTRYPAASAPWSGPQVGIEPPLGWSVEDQEPTGTAQEIEASIASSEVSFLYSDDVIAPPSPFNQPLEERGGGGVSAAALSSPNPGSASEVAGAAPGSPLARETPAILSSLDEEAKALLDLIFSKPGKAER
jgi:hypothetical protein